MLVRKVIFAWVISLLASFAPTVIQSAAAADLQLPLTPQFGNYQPLDGGFSVQISNYDSAFSWAGTCQIYTTSGNSSTTASCNGPLNISTYGVITVSSITPGAKVTLTVTSSRSGYYSGQGNFTGTVTLRTFNFSPVLALLNRSDNSFDFQVSNYNPAYTWLVSSTLGSASLGSNGIGKVTGLKLGQSAKVTVTVRQAGYTDNQASIDGYTNSPNLNLAPVLGSITANQNNFTVQISNFNESYEWRAVSDRGTASVDSKGLVTVSNIDPSTIVNLTVTTLYSGAKTGQVSIIGYGNIGALTLTPQFGAIQEQYLGFNFQVANFNPLFTWRASSSMGIVSLSNSGVVTVTNLRPGDQASVTVFARFSNYPEKSSTIVGKTYPSLGLNPKSSTPISTKDGFTFTISEMNSFYEYFIKTDIGTIEGLPGSNLSITGLEPGTSANLVLQTSKFGQLLNELTISGKSLVEVALPAAPTFAPAPIPKATATQGSSSGKANKPVLNIKTISCVKGKSHKFVTGKAPKCPAGYKLEK